MSMSRESRIVTPRRSKRRRWKGQSACLVVLFQILLAQSLIIRGLVLGWTLPRLSSPSYTREYAYWKKADISTCAKEDEKKESLTYTQAFRQNGVERPPWKVPPFFWKWAYRVQLKVLPILHAFDDSANRIPNSSLSLPILWWKALMRRTNPSAAEWAYDLLPGRTRWIVRVFHRFFPPLHHVNIQLRTTFLDNRTITIANQIRSSKPDAKVRLVVLGAGYDLRSLRFLQEGIVDEAIELDLPNVIQAKKMLLESSTFQHRRPSCELPTMAGANLNDIETTNATLCELLQPTNQAQDHTYTIFLLEGILVHLESGSSSKILQLLHSYCGGSNNNNSNGCLVFCDRIQGVNNRSLDLARTVLHEAEWKLTEFLATPTRTPHFGVAFPTDTVL
eukprot:scaffold3299_cov95-Cylindrotheca_fusiformis.AAC.1